MPEGVRVEVKLTDPDGCAVTAATAAADSASDNVSKAVIADENRVTEEFMMADDAPPASLPDGMAPVFAYGDRTIYRFERECDRGCPCDVVESHDCPVVDVHCRGDDLFLTFHAPDVERLQTVVGDLQERFEDLDVRRLLRTATDDSSGSTVLLDRGVLTARQREVLETAHDRGYFDHPKRVNASEVATEIGISTSTFSEHLAAAQRKLLDEILAG